MFGWGLFFCILGVAVALFPSNYEISGMDEDESQNQSHENADGSKSE